MKMGCMGRMGMMGRMSGLVLMLLVTFAGCAGRRTAAHSPQLTGAIGKSEDVTNTISLAQGDNKEVKRAIGGIQGHSSEVRRLHLESMSALDRIDYKATILLK
jgi:hypothetical protein